MVSRDKGREMDQIFDRLGNLLKSVLQDDSDDDPRPSQKTSFSDPDLQDAWAELNEFMNTGTETEKSTKQTSARPLIPRELEKDYKLLGVSHTAGMEEIAKTYKKLLSKHHPDRFASDPAAFEKATENAKRISASFQRIKQYKASGKL